MIIQPVPLLFIFYVYIISIFSPLDSDTPRSGTNHILNISNGNISNTYIMGDMIFSWRWQGTSSSRVSTMDLFYKFLLIITSMLISFDRLQDSIWVKSRKLLSNDAIIFPRTASQDEPHQQHMGRNMKIAAYLWNQVWGLQCCVPLLLAPERSLGSNIHTHCTDRTFSHVSLGFVVQMTNGRKKK